jgi:hypothetical protein
MNEIARWVEEVTHPNHPLYHPVQCTLFGTISWIGASLFSIARTNAMAVTILAYAINQLATPQIGKWLEPFHEMALVPFSGQILNLSVSLGSANLLCHLADKSLGFSEIALLGAFLFVAVAIIEIALDRFASFS